METHATIEPVTARRAGRKSAGVTAADIHEKLLNAIVEHRLPPGTQLVEDKLAGVFGVSRTKIRQALGRLAHDLVVEILPNRGAFVARPSVEFAREVFETRRIIEPALLARLIARVTPAQIQKLRAHLAREAAAHARGERRAVIRLSGEFHLLIAEMAGNSLLARQLREVESLTALIIILYEGPRHAACPADEHAALVDAIERGDAQAASSLMLAHLAHVEASLDLRGGTGGSIDFATVFA